jgi:hypothetical protein
MLEEGVRVSKMMMMGKGINPEILPGIITAGSL